MGTNGKFILSVKDKVRKNTWAREKLPTSEKFFDATSISRMGNASSQSPTTHLAHTQKKRYIGDTLTFLNFFSGVLVLIQKS